MRGAHVARASESAHTARLRRRATLLRAHHDVAWPVWSDDRLLAWTERLRHLLPDSGGAASAARRDELWQRMEGGVDAVAYDRLELFLLDLTLQTKLVSSHEASSLLFMGAALFAAADEIGLRRASFRLLLQRMHAYLDVHTALGFAAAHPYYSRVTRESLDLLLAERRHSMRLTPGGAVLRADAIFAGLLARGSEPRASISFDELARWSMQAQYVRPGSGALLYQKRLPAHWLDPRSVGTHGFFKSPRSRKVPPRVPRPPPLEGVPAAPLDFPPPPSERLRRPIRQQPPVAPVRPPPMPPPHHHGIPTLPPPVAPALELRPEPEPRPPPKPLEIVLPPPAPTPPRVPTPPPVPRVPAPRRRMQRLAQMGAGCDAWNTKGKAVGLGDGTYF